jgi:hypothetical protein
VRNLPHRLFTKDESLVAMHLRSLTVTGLLAAGLAAGAVVAIAEETGPVPSGIVLDGVTTILGDNRACFKVTFTNGRPEADFILAEGQAKYGIQLLAVDRPLSMVTIRNQGLTQTIPICKTPTLLAATLSAADRAASKKPGGNDNLDTVATGDAQAPGNEMQPAATGQFGQAGHAVGTGGFQSHGSQNGASGNPDNNTAPANDSGASDSTGPSDNTPQGYLYQWWVKEAEKVERARVETAQRVTAGEWPPYPLTPLTPPGTPAQLIGADSLFMDHGPGVMISSN